MEKELFQVQYHVVQIASIMDFADSKGRFQGSEKEVCFIRCIGYEEGYQQQIEQMDKRLSLQEASRAYCRIEKLPQLVEPEKIKYYTKVYGRWEAANGSIPIESSGRSAWFDTEADGALRKVREIFSCATPNASESMIRNFMIKLLYWTDCAAGEILQDWKECGCYKFVYCGIPKKQEYLFLYFLTGLGIDVLILSPEKELELDRSLLKLSASFRLKETGNIVIPKYQKELYAKAVQSRNQELQQEENQKAQPLKNMSRVVIPPRPGKSKSQNQSAAASGEIRTKTAIAAGAKGVIAEGAECVSTAKSREGDREKTFEELAQLASSVVMITIHNAKGEVLGTGSGIMLAANGYILTNNHVASGGTYYSIRIEDDEKVYQTKELIKYHSILDLALIRIERRLAPIPIYRGKEKLVRGQKVVAIGSPLGFFNSVSDGIISGFRNIDDVNMIQFTAPISHGSSGGALLNMQGEVIGISTAGIDSGQNINLAVDYQDIANFVRGFL